MNFSHKNIIKYCNRPFKSKEEMDETMVKNWNSVVSSGDTVYHLGDFSFYNSTIKTNQMLLRLNGKIIFCQGNHDKDINQIFPRLPQIIILRHEGRRLILCHYAMRVWDNSHRNSWHLYGHSHGTLPSIGKSHDVGVDSNKFTPISFDQLKDIMSKKPDNGNCLPDFKGK